MEGTEAMCSGDHASRVRAMCSARLLCFPAREKGEGRRQVGLGWKRGKEKKKEGRCGWARKGNGLEGEERKGPKQEVLCVLFFSKDSRGKAKTK